MKDSIIDDKLDIFEQIVSEGSTVIIKLDGERKLENISNYYTVVVSGGKLHDDFFRKDSNDLIELCDEAISFYNSK
ncbi:MAG: hypothetical protein GY756_20830 [bacterium]|nr:hypothetical protein [bacterium]